jgi:hypothetical protein
MHPVSRRYLYCALLLVGCLVLGGCSNVNVQDERELRVMPPAAPTVIYVADFQLNAESFRAESGLLQISPAHSDLLGEFIPRILGLSENPAARGLELVSLMSSTLVEDLTNAGLNTRHLAAGEVLPSKGWLVRGAFTQLDEGDRLRRALIGFDSGVTRLRVTGSLSDLSQNKPPEEFCELDASAHSSKAAGAAISFNPYVGVARFVIDGLDLDTNVMQTAAVIARDIAERYNTGKPPHHWMAELKGIL